MINFITDIDKSFIVGNKHRYIDFFEFADDYNISYTNTDNINNDVYNIIDLRYLCNNTDIILNDKCKFFCGYSLRIIELLSNNCSYVYKDLILNNIVSHNLYYCKCFNGTFLPMYIYKNINRYSVNNKYKYGMFITHENDVNYILINDIMNKLNINKEDILFMDREQYFDYSYNTTQDNEFFINNIDTFLDIANDYTNRHIFSRTYLEIINNDINFNIISYNNSKPTSFLNFNHIQYDLIDNYDDFEYINVKYDKKYFKMENYSNYIKEVVVNNKFNILYNYVEDYCNDRFIAN